MLDLWSRLRAVVRTGRRNGEGMTDLRRLAHAAVVTGFVGPTVPDWLARRIDAGLGGVCWFAHNVEDEQQATKLADDLHGLGPVLVMSDEEGGDVTRLEAATGSSYPSHAALGALDDVDATRRVAAAMGRRLRDVGIDVALAPVRRRERRPREPRDRHAILRCDTRPRGPPRRRVRQGPAGRRCRGVRQALPGPRFDPHRLPPRPAHASPTPSRCCSSATWRRSGRRSRPECGA